MMKKPLIIMGLILYFSILITGAPSIIDINSYGNLPFFSLENVSHLVYAQVGSEKSDSGNDSEKSDSGNDSEKSDSGNDSEKSDSGNDSEKSDSGNDSEKSDFDSNLGTR